MSLFDKLVHDFGLTAWSPQEWQTLGGDKIHAMAKQAPKGWWRDSILMYQYRGITQHTRQAMLERVYPLADWLLRGDHTGTYFDPRVVPRDIRGVIYGYLGYTTTVRDSYTTRTVTFCGLQHSWNDAPSTISRGANETIYWWHILGRKERERGAPSVVCVQTDREVIMWMDPYLRTLSRSKVENPFLDSTEATTGDGSEIDLLIAEHVAMVKQYDVPDAPRVAFFAAS